MLTNPPFIEAYMVGLNHEFARELLWREYPTDQRGPPFRQFWEPCERTGRPEPATEAQRAEKLQGHPAAPRVAAELARSARTTTASRRRPASASCS